MPRAADVRQDVTHRSAAFLVVVLVLASCAAPPRARDQVDPRVETAAWEALPEGPLTPRRSAHGFALDGKFVVVGGTSAEACPPAADCVEPAGAPHRDGAVFDPSTGTWTTISDAPVPLGFGSGAVAGGRIFLLLWDIGSSHPAVRAAFVSYDPARDTWTELPPPPGEDMLTLTEAGSTIVAYQSSQEYVVGHDFVFDDGKWSELPADPLRPSYDRSIVATPHGLVLLGIEHVSNPGGERPNLYRAALLDGDAWHRLPDSEVVGWNPIWSWTGGRVVNAATASADGGEVNGWGRSYPAGGILELGTRSWSDLPRPPDPAAGMSSIPYVAGPLAIASDGWVFDSRTDGWTRLPEPDGAPDGEAAAAWVGAGLFLWGGVVYDDRGSRLLARGWSWEAPR